MVLHLPRDAVSVPICRQVLNGCLGTLGVTPDTRADIALALSEACANVVQHAYLGDPEPGAIELEAELSGNQLVISVRDHGHGFAPRLDSPGAGLGLPVIASLTDRLEIRPTPGSGTEIMMAFALNEAA